VVPAVAGRAYARIRDWWLGKFFSRKGRKGRGLVTRDWLMGSSPRVTAFAGHAFAWLRPRQEPRPSRGRYGVETHARELGNRKNSVVIRERSAQD